MYCGRSAPGCGAIEDFVAAAVEEPLLAWRLYRERGGHNRRIPHFEGCAVAISRGNRE
jgi:hypothetical protein